MIVLNTNLICVLLFSAQVSYPIKRLEKTENSNTTKNQKNFLQKQYKIIENMADNKEDSKVEHFSFQAEINQLSESHWIIV